MADRRPGLGADRSASLDPGDARTGRRHEGSGRDHNGHGKHAGAQRADDCAGVAAAVSRATSAAKASAAAASAAPSIARAFALIFSALREEKSVMPSGLTCRAAANIKRDSTGGLATSRSSSVDHVAAAWG